MKPRIAFLSAPVKGIIPDFLDIGLEETEDATVAEIVYMHQGVLNYSKMPNLKLILCPCTGIEHLQPIPDGVTVIYLDDKKFLYRYVHSTAEWTIFAILTVLRGAEDEIWGKRVGLIGGAGRVGTQVVKKLTRLTPNFAHYYDIEESKALEAQRAETLGELFTVSDIISLHLSEQYNVNFLTILQLQQMKDKKVRYLINSARSSLINGDDLVTAIHKHYFAGVMIDVSESYSREVQRELYALSRRPHQYNFHITPHVAGKGAASRINTDQYIYKKTFAHFNKAGRWW